MENIKFKAEQREKTGGLTSKQSIYNDRKIPGIIYGGKDKPLPILINENDLIRVTSNAGLFNSLVEVEVGDKKEMVVFKEVQKHPSKMFLLMLICKEWSMEQKLTLLYQLSC